MQKLTMFSQNFTIILNRQVIRLVSFIRQLKCYATICMLSVNPVMFDNDDAFFNYTPVGRASDSMMAPT